MNASSWSRTLSTTEISPPGTYSSRISMPTPLANSWSSWLPSKTVGIPTTTIVPITAPVTDVRPPTTETASTLSDCCGREVVGHAGRVPGGEQATGERGDAARDREGDDLRPRRRHGVGGRVGLVVAHREERAAQPGLAEVRDEQDHEDRDDEAEVVVALLVVEEVPWPDRAVVAASPLASERVVEEVEVEHPGAHDQREAERDHAEIEAAHAQRRDADHDRDHARPRPPRSRPPRDSRGPGRPGGGCRRRRWPCRRSTR